MSNSIKGLISICVITYNQDKYVINALESVLMQKNVGFEVIISDDCSTDKTTHIIESFIKSNRLDWKLIKHNKNQGMQKNWAESILAAKGEFIAILEGDDYWLDEYKLEKQLNILKNNLNFSACFSDALIVDEIANIDRGDYVSQKNVIYTFNSILENNSIPTCSILFRKNKFEIPELFYESPIVDWILHLIVSLKGNYFFINEKLVVYRMNNGGVYSGVNLEKQIIKKIETLRILFKIFKASNKKNDLINRLITEYQKLAYFYKNNGKFLRFVKYKTISKWFSLKHK
jgi:glycosyltransferase involved in cell wall biosynthesis